MSTSTGAPVTSYASASSQPSNDADAVWYYVDTATSAQQGPVTPGDLADRLQEQEINSATYGSERRA
jgi:hypothetical protein